MIEINLILLISISVFTVFTLLGSLLAIRNLLKKTENLEEIVEDYEETIKNQNTYIETISQIVSTSKKKIKELDDKGAFESDDEVGTFFKHVKEIQDTLNTFIIEDGKKEQNQ